MDVSSADEAYERLFPFSSNQSNKDTFWEVIKHLDLGDEWELKPVSRKIPLRGGATFAILWNNYSSRTYFREAADRIFVKYDSFDDEYAVHIPSLVGEYEYKNSERTELDYQTFENGQSAGEYINRVAPDARENIVRNAFVETNHERSIRVAFDPVSGKFIRGKDKSWSESDSAHISAGSEDDALADIDRLNGRDDYEYTPEGELIDPDDPKTITAHTSNSIISIHGVGEETAYSVAFEFGTYDNLAAASISEVYSKVNTSSYYSPDLTEMRNKAVTAVQTANRIYEKREANKGNEE